jgi:antitoxin component YwqK of YwqJK toxin-antitoxin module
MLHQGHLFTGTAVRRWPNGQLRVQMNFVDGIEDGWVRGWHENGVARSETFYRRGRVVGVRRGWYSNSQLKLEEEIEHGSCVWGKEWSETGDLVKDYVLPKDHPEYKMLQRMRERERSKNGLS